MNRDIIIFELELAIKNIKAGLIFSALSNLIELKKILQNN